MSRRMARAERLRGFEFEFDSEATTYAMFADGACKSHLTFCKGPDGCKKLPKAAGDFDCDCERCKKIAARSKTEVPECKGHPCLEAGVNIERWFAKLLEDGVEPTQIPLIGSGNDWAKSPKSAFIWHFKRDGSCGWELATPPSDGKNMLPMISGVLDVVKKQEEMHGKKFTSAKCGLHCTIGVEDLTQADLVKLVYFVSTHQDALLKTQKVDRERNEHCKKLQYFGDYRKLVSEGFEGKHMVAVHSDRRLVANFTRALKDGVVEFRFGSMTTEAKEVAAFGTMIECVVQAAIEGRKESKDKTKPKKAQWEAFKEAVFVPYMDDGRVRTAWEIIEKNAR